MSKENQCQYCKKCGRDQRFEFSICDEIWNKLPEIWQNHILCIECFLEELNNACPTQKIQVSDFVYMCILDPSCNEDYNSEYPKLLHPMFGGTLINNRKLYNQKT